jgi:hypothetical protein
LHLGSLLSSAAGGIWRQDTLRSVQNVMIQTKAVPPGTPPEDAVEVRQNVSFADYIKALDRARNAHDPRVQALRITRPIVMTALVARMRSQHIDINLDQPQLPRFAIRSLSPPDPSGWARINLVRTGGTPLEQTQPTQDVLPGPSHRPAVPGSTTP